MPFKMCKSARGREYKKDPSSFKKACEKLSKANGQASLGKYVAGSVTGAGADAGLFVANHAY